MERRTLGGGQFPYHISNNGIQSLGKYSNPVSSPNKKTFQHSDAPSTYMVVNFDQQFVAAAQSEIPTILHLDKQQMQSRMNKVRGMAPDDDRKKLPLMSSSFLLPKVSGQAERVMFRRSDVGTQTDLNMKTIRFDHLNGYQKWNSEVVEPFLKDLRKHIKEKRPQDVPSYIIRYCQAMQKNEPAPVTLDEGDS
mmetsp:Transcript_22153/g.48025  ORF Transcript_22153/g.48025 Transcript_22153/m.48025 type:complete len:193 (+) Transcript_22153:121-699(+)